MEVSYKLEVGKAQGRVKLNLVRMQRATTNPPFLSLILLSCSKVLQSRALHIKHPRFNFGGGGGGGGVGIMRAPRK